MIPPPRLHEAYKLNGEGISWTENAVDPMYDAKVLRQIANMVDNKVVFTEEELEEYNRSVE